MRFAHYLRQNEKDEIPSQFICVDTETRPEKHADGSETDRLWFGWAVYQRSRARGEWCAPEWYRFEERRAFWLWVLSKARPKTTLYLFAHNTSFDLPVLGAFTVTRKLGLKLKFAIIDAPPTILKWQTGKATIKCLDTLNLWRMPLAKLGEMIGAPKLPMPPRRASRRKWDEYCKQDVEVLRRALVEWWSFLVRESLGNFRPTLASQALGTFKHRYMPPRMLVHTRSDVLKIERASYHGGRCDCFYVGKRRGNFTLLDVNSMYPAVMEKFEYPIEVLWSHRAPTVGKIERALASHLAIAEVLVETETPVYPLVWDNKLVFPVGRFWTTLTTQELAHAMRQGEVKDVRRLVEYRGARCFAGFVRDFYARRLQAIREGNSTRSWQLKILLNTLYGKFGQTGRVWSKLKHTSDERSRVWTEVNVDTRTVRKFRQLAGLIQSFTEEPESAESMPAIAAHVTANARMLLWHYMARAGARHVFYCDTDSLLVDQEGRDHLERFIDAERLGALKVEGEYHQIQIWGPKDYRFGDKVRHKGIRAKAKQIAPNQWKQWQWSSLVGLVRSGQIDAPRRIPVTKTLGRHFTKGEIEPSNWVRPLRMIDPTS